MDGHLDRPVIHLGMGSSVVVSIVHMNYIICIVHEPSHVGMASDYICKHIFFFMNALKES
jgi:hypothetical protein